MHSEIKWVIYNYENEKNIIKRREDFLIVTLKYSNTVQIITGEKTLTIDAKGKRFQFESYYWDLVVNPQNYRDLMDNFGKWKWIDIDFAQTDDKVNSILSKNYNCEYDIKN